MSNWKKDELIVGSFILFIMMSLSNFINYLFHFSMARFLGPEDYGILATLMSIIYIYAIFGESIQTIMSRYTSNLNSNNELGKIKDVIIRSLKKFGLFSTIIFILASIVLFLVSSYLNIDRQLLIITNLLIFFMFISPALRGVLQGSKKFKSLGINLLLESTLKLILSISLVLIGFKVYGALIGILLGAVVSLVAIFISLKDIISSKRISAPLDNIYSYNLPIFICMISIVLMYSLDIIIAKIIFDPIVAGKYAVLSMLGKIIFFGTMAIAKTMFPLSIENYQKGKNTKYIFIKSIKITFILIFLVMTIYTLIPKIVINVLFGAQYLDIYRFLSIIGLAYSFISISNLLLLYSISINPSPRRYYFSLLFPIIQITLLVLFGSDILNFSMGVMISGLIFLIYSICVIKDEKR